MEHCLNTRKSRLIIMGTLVTILALLLWGAVELAYAQGLPTVSITSQGDVTEGDDAVFDVTASSAPSSDLTIGVTVSQWPSNGNVAAFGGIGQKTVTIPAGQTKATLTVGTVDDSTKEPRAMIAAVLHTPASNAGYRLSPAAGYGVVVVEDNDAAVPAVSVSAGNDVSENGTVIFTLTTSSLPQQAITVNVNVATTGAFGVKTGAHTVTIPSTGSGSERLILLPHDDSVNEADGSVTATVQTGSGYTVGSPTSATVKVADNDVPEVSVAADADITEGEAATFTVTASPTPYQALPVTVNVVTSGVSGASAGVRTVTVSTNGSGTLTVATTDNSAHARDGSVTATVQPGSGYTVGNPSSDTVGVYDNDGPAVTITADADVTEGSPASFTLTANPAPSNALSVQLKVAATGDFGVRPGAKTAYVFSNGTGTFTVPTTGDNVDEPNGAVTVTVKPDDGSNIYRYTVGTPDAATVNVNDDDATVATKPVLTITPGPDITEGEDATFTITANPPVPTGETLEVYIDPQIPGYVNLRFKETITGATTTITQPSDDNQYDEADYSMSYSIAPGSGYTLGDPSKATVNIADNDVPKVSLRGPSGRNASINEDGEAHFSINVNPVPYQDLTVSVQVTTTGDFGVQAGARQLSIPANKSNASFGIAPVPDHVHEPDGSITVTVNPNSSYEIVGLGTATVVVKDDDPPPGPRVNIANPQGKARAGEKFAFAVTLSEAAEGEVSMDYEIGHFSALLIPEVDYWDDDNGVSGSVVFAAGELEAVINVHISRDAWFNHNDRIYVILDNLEGEASFAHSYAEGRLNAR